MKWAFHQNETYYVVVVTRFGRGGLYGFTRFGQTVGGPILLNILGGSYVCHLGCIASVPNRATLMFLRNIEKPLYLCKYRGDPLS